MDKAEVISTSRLWHWYEPQTEFRLAGNSKYRRNARFNRALLGADARLAAHLAVTADFTAPVVALLPLWMPKSQPPLPAGLDFPLITWRPFARVSMFSLSGVFARFRRTKQQPDPATVQEYPVEIGGEQTSDEAHQEFEAWQRRWIAIQRGIDELVAHLNQESRT